MPGPPVRRGAAAPRRAVRARRGGRRGGRGRLRGLPPLQGRGERAVGGGAAFGRRAHLRS